MSSKYILALTLASLSMVSNAQYKVFENSNEIKEIMETMTCEDNMSLCRQISTYEVIAGSVACTNFVNTIQNKSYKEMNEDIDILMSSVNRWQVFNDQELRKSLDQNAPVVNYFENIYEKYLTNIPVTKMIEFCNIRNVINEQKNPESYGIIMKHKKY